MSILKAKENKSDDLFSPYYLPLRKKTPVYGKKNRIIVIAGPTGVGKTEIGISVAKMVGGEIISDFGPEPQESEGRVSVLETRVGAGGPRIELQTTQARIDIKK